MKTIILIAGGTASGKTMIAKVLTDEYIKKGLSTTLMSMDNYYFSLEELPEEKGMDVNWDSPKVINWKRFDSDLDKLYNGEDIQITPYNFEKFTHTGEPITIKSSEVIIIEGLFALLSNKAREIATSRIFVHADEDVRLIRRIKRDSTGRYKEGFDLDVFMRKWIKEIKPMHRKHIKPTNDYADFIIKNNEEFVGEEKERMLNLLQSLMVK